MEEKNKNSGLKMRQRLFSNELGRRLNPRTNGDAIVNEISHGIAIIIETLCLDPFC